MSQKSPLWRDENLYFRLPVGYKEEEAHTGHRSALVSPFSNRRYEDDGFEILANVLNHIRSANKHTGEGESKVFRYRK